MTPETRCKDASRILQTNKFNRRIDKSNKNHVNSNNSPSDNEWTNVMLLNHILSCLKFVKNLPDVLQVSHLLLAVDTRKVNKWGGKRLSELSEHTQPSTKKIIEITLSVTE